MRVPGFSKKTGGGGIILAGILNKKTGSGIILAGKLNKKTGSGIILAGKVKKVRTWNYFSRRIKKKQEEEVLF